MVKFEHKNKRKLLFPVILSALVLLGIGGTIAVNRDQSFFSNLFHLKYGQNSTVETFDSPDDWKRCEETPKTVVTNNDSTFNIRVRLSYDEYWLAADNTTYLPLTQNGDRLTTINLQNQNDWEDGNDGWMYWKGTLAPGASTRSLLKSVTYNCDSNVAVETICQNTATGTICEQAEDPYENAKYHVFVTVQTTDADGEFPADTYYNVSIDPNGGEFNGSSNVYTDSVKSGTLIDLRDISYTNFEFRDWTKNDTDTYTGQLIKIDGDTTLVANWLSNIFHTITVNPNGGSYDSSTNPSDYSVREGSNYEILEATRENYALEGWEYVGGDHDGEAVSGNTLSNIADDVVIRAIWAPAVARIERTQKLYSSIMRAEAEAQTNDTITLLTNTTETVTNEKTITLDLNEYTVTGSLTNTATGNITLINGEINNPDGIAVTNNGTLTMGINDFKPDGHVNIINDYIRLVGTTTGIKQNGVFNFYDGYLEGDVGLEGGYDDAPVYRNTYDDATVHYFPLVDHIGDTSRQHVELAGADRAVSKTTVGGDIYYYNLQDNINTSIRTGYQIYAVRDFDASYPLTVPAGEEAVFDIIGFNVTFADTTTINGTFTVLDSTTTVTRGDATVVYGGLITTPQTIINNGTLNLNKVKITASTSNDTIQNNGDINMTSSIIASATGYVTRIVANSTWTMDANSKLYSSSSNTAAVYDAVNYTYNNFNIGCTWRAIELARNTAIILDGNSKIELTNDGNSSTTAIQGDYYDSLTLKGNSSIIVNSENITTYWDNVTTYAIQRMAISMEDNSSINVTARIAYGFYSENSITMKDNSSLHVSGYKYAIGAGLSYGSFTVQDNADVLVESSGPNNTMFIEGNSSTVNFNGGTVKVKSTGSGSATAVYASVNQGTTNYNSGTIEVETNTSTAYGHRNSTNDTVNFNGSTIIAKSTSGDAYGALLNNGGTSLRMTGGSITATSTSGTGYGINSACSGTITGGTIYGSTYGLYTSGAPTIGANDGTIDKTTPIIEGGNYGVHGGSINFYDGTLKGDLNAVEGNSIQAIPDGSTIHAERAKKPEDPDDPAQYTGTESSWLVAAENYLEVDGVEFNSLTAAYDAVEDGGTIKVIADFSTNAAPPESPSNKAVTIDLNNHTLIYTQPLINTNVMTITDNSNEKSGGIINSNAYVIINHGTLNIASGTITGSTSDYAIYNDTNGNKTKQLNMTGGKITSTIGNIYAGNNTAIVLDGNAAIELTADGNSSTTAIQGDYYDSLTLKGNSSIIVNSENITTYWDNVTTYAIQRMAISMEDNSSINVTARIAYGFYSENSITMKDNSSLHVSGYKYAIGAGLSYGSFTVQDNADVLVESSGPNNTMFIEGNSSTVNFNGGTVKVKSTGSGSATAVYASVNQGTTNYNSGTIEVETNTSTAYGHRSNTNDTVNFNGSTIIAKSTSGDAYGALLNNGGTSLRMTGGSITATSTSGTGYGINSACNGTITGGTIYGSTYGLYTSGAPTIGANDGTIDKTTPIIEGGNYGVHGGSINFYDGTLKGDLNAVEGNSIQAIPDGSTIHAERAKKPEDPDDPAQYTGTESSWLVAAENYLEVDGVEFNSLTAAYDAVEDGGTIKVIADFSTNAAPPESPSNKAVTIDLNNHTLIYTQPLINTNVMTITDNSNEKSGGIINSNTYVIINHGTLNIASGTITGSTSDYAIYNDTNGNKTKQLNMTGGKITSTIGNIYAGNNTAIVLDGNAAIELTADGNSSTTAIQGDYYDSLTLKGNSSIIVNSENITTYWDNVTTYAIQRMAISMEDNSSINVTARIAYGFYSENSITMKDNSSLHVSGYKYAIGAGLSYGSFTVQDNADVLVESSGPNNTMFIEGNSSTVNFNGGTVKVKSTGSGSATAVYASVNQGTTNYNSGTIEVETNTSTAYGHRNSTNDTVNFNGSTIIAKSTSGDAYGALLNNGGTSLRMTGGSITATSTSGTGYGINSACNGTITGGTIYGSTYGLYTSGAPTIGANDGTIDKTTPIIEGGNYGVHGGSINFYDGTVLGGLNAWSNVDVVKDIEANSTVYLGTTTIDNVEYEESYLIAEYDVAQIGTKKYKKLSEAVDEAVANDTIELIADNYMFYSLTIPSDKNITIETNGHKTVTGNQITNNGNVTIVNSHPTDKPVYAYRSSNYYIVNNGTLSIQNIPISAPYGINNTGTLTLQNLNISSTNTAISSTGSAQLDSVNINSSNIAIRGNDLIINNNSTLNGTNYAVYIDGGSSSSIDNSTLTGTYAYYQNATNTEASIDGSTLTGVMSNNAGKLEINSTTIARSISDESDYERLLFNTGTGETIFDNVQATYTYNNSWANSNYTTYTFYNSNIATIKNSAFTMNLTGIADQQTYGVYSDGSSLNIENSSIIVDASASTSDRRNSYGLYNNSGNVTINSSIISANRILSDYGIYNDSGNILITGSSSINSGTASTTTSYGIYNNTGEITLGVAEPTDSPNWGLDTADVSTTEPSVRAIGTSSGIGIKNISGRVNFYDGRIIATTTTLAETPTKVEYQYEPQTYTDGDGYLYTILEWMRS